MLGRSLVTGVRILDPLAMLMAVWTADCWGLLGVAAIRPKVMGGSEDAGAAALFHYHGGHQQCTLAQRLFLEQRLDCGESL